MKITPAPKRLLALRRRREGACCLKGHKQPSSRSKRDLLGRRSGDGAVEECPILNWVFREQRSLPRRGFPKGRVPLGVTSGTNFYSAAIQDREQIPTQRSEWIVRLYPGNRRAGGTASAETGAETIPPSVPLNTKRYQPKQRQALSRTNSLAAATTMGFQRDESLWAYPPHSCTTLC